MEKEPKLKTKLSFRFNTEDLEFGDLDFLSDDPIEKTNKEIRIMMKNIRKDPRKRENPKLF